MCPILWIEVDKNAHLRRDYDYSAVPPKYKRFLVGWRHFESTEGLRADSVAADVDSQLAVGAHKPMYPFVVVSSPTVIFKKEKHTDILYRKLTEGIFEGGFPGEQSWPRAPQSMASKTRDEVCGFA